MVQGSLRQGSYSEEAGACLEEPISSRAREDTSLPMDQPTEAWLLGASLRAPGLVLEAGTGEAQVPAQPGHQEH